jgi:hypothetical protein
MKTQNFRILLMLMVVAALGAATVSAGPSEKIKASIPFAFTVGNATLPAGEYDVERRAAYGGMLFIRNAEGRGAAAQATNQVKGSVKAATFMLVFHRYGNHYFLFQVWSPGTNVGQELPSSLAEREAARVSSDRLADAEPEVVTITVK